MYKDLINKHLSQGILSEEKVNGITVTDKVQKEEGNFNKEYYKDVKKKMGDYDDAAKKKGKDSIDPPKKEYSSEEEEYHDQMEIRNGMEMLKYDNKPDERFKERQEMALKGDSKMGNKTYTGEENGNTEEVWGASGGKHTGEELVKAIKASAKKRNDAEYNLIQFGDDIEQSGEKKTRGKARKVAVENKSNNDKPLNETKMEKKKRLRFNKDGDKPFDGLGNALQLIPENYRVDGKEFEMTDGIENYDIRWEGDLNEGRAIVLKAADSNMVNEDIQHMKHLMSYSSEATQGNLKGAERLTENTDNSFRTMLDKTRALLNEETQTEGEVITEGENIEGKKAPVSSKVWTDADGPKGDNHAEHVMEEDEVSENEETVSETEDLNETTDLREGLTEEQIAELNEIEEGLFDRFKGPSKEDLFMKKLKLRALAATKLGFAWSPEIAQEILAAAKADGYAGDIVADRKTKTVRYVPSTEDTGASFGGGYGAV